MSSRPPPKPKVLNPIDSSATLPARMIRSAQEIFRPYFCLIGPDQAARLVEAHIVRPTVEGSKSLRSGARAAAAIGDAVGACAMPRHADEERPIVAVVRGPPVLRGRHQGMEVLDHSIQVEALELLGVIEFLAHGIGQLRSAGAGSSGSVDWATSWHSLGFQLQCVSERRSRTGTLFRPP